jgi:hypothetical protein
MPKKTWDKILAVFEDKLQLNFVQQAKLVSGVQIEGSTLELEVTTGEALEFFSSPINQQRLIIMSRGVAPIEHVAVRLSEKKR